LQTRDSDGFPRKKEAVMVYVTLFEKLFEIDLRSPDRPARWWFIDGWVDHGLTNEEVLFYRDTRPLAGPLVEAVETFWTSRAA
jgi:hypothetical protein